MTRLLARIADTLSVAFRGRVESPPVEQASTDALLGEVAASVPTDTRDYDGDSRKPVAAPIAPRRPEESWSRLEADMAPPPPPPLPPAGTQAPAPAKPGKLPAQEGEDKGWGILGGI